MRYIVVLLVVLNVAYLFWNWYSPPPEAVILGAPGLDRGLLNTGLTLVEEFDARNSQQQPDSAENAAGCLFIDGFTTVDDARLAMRSYSELGWQAGLVLEGEALPPRFRVLVPPMSSQAIAALTLDGLAEALAETSAEIETYLITRGLQANGIALGVFSTREAAASVQAEVSNLGYEVELEEIPRSSGAIRVQVELADSGAENAPQPPEISDLQPDLTFSQNLCQTIAQASQFP